MSEFSYKTFNLTTMPETLNQIEPGLERKPFDNITMPDRVRMQKEVMEQLGVTKEAMGLDQQAAWIAANGQTMRDIIAQDSEFKRLAKEGDWEGAKKYMVEKLRH